MPRLLLVDDNPSIHRIAESLLAPTDIELTCADSAEDALDRLARGERFDVALVDTAMPGMDGWTLLAKLRTMEATAHLPIALMAGVLDPVDPVKLAKAPVQGFLKKPIELRELGERVKTLLATPVVPVVEASPFSTIPSTPIKDLFPHPEPSLPEYRADFLPEMPDLSEPPEPAGLEPLVVSDEADLLVLGPEDLWPEDPELDQGIPLEAAPEIQLELEELDLESLQDLTDEPLSMPPYEEVAASLVVDHDPSEEQVVEFPPLKVDTFFPEPEEEALLTITGLDDLDVLEAKLPVADEPEAELEPALGTNPEPELLEDLLDLSAQEPPAPAAGGQALAAEGQSGFDTQRSPQALSPAVASADSSQAQAVLQALLAEPVLMDALVTALVARMGDKVLREVLWEALPDLAERLQR